MKIDGYQIELTCHACPEQYDVFDSRGEQVGYLRLRHGYFAAYFPDSGGECVFSAEPQGDGMFESYERYRYLELAIKAIDAKVKFYAGDQNED